MGRGGKSRGGSSKRPRKKGAPPSKKFDHGIPDPFDNTALYEGQSWTDHYRHSTRTTFDCQGCGRTYSTLHHLTSHERGCFSNKRSINALLEESKAFWESKKKRRLEGPSGGLVSSSQHTDDSGTRSDGNRENLPNGDQVNTNQEGGVEPNPANAPGLSGSGSEANRDGECSSTGPSEPNQSLEETGGLPVEELASTIDAPESVSDLDVPVANRKAMRPKQVPNRYKDNAYNLPEPPGPVENVNEIFGSETGNLTQQEAQGPIIGGTDKPENEPEALTEQAKERVLFLHESRRNAFGVIRRYILPTRAGLLHDPERLVTLSNLTDAPQSKRHEEDKLSAHPLTETEHCDEDKVPKPRLTDEPQPKQREGDKFLVRRYGPKPKRPEEDTLPVRRYGPFASKTAFSLADWYWNSTNKSFSDFQKLVNIIKDPTFAVEDIVSVNWSASFKSLGANREDLSDYDGAWIADDGWKSTPISIEVPFHNRMKINQGTERYVLGNLRHRSIVSVIKEKITNAHDSSKFHYHPYRATWKRNDDSPEVELYGEFYWSREFRSAHEELQKLSLPRADEPDGPELERVVVALMFWSDGTHLTSFGTASLWPCYLYFGNESKYRRSKPSENLVNQIAYFEKLPDVFTDYLKERNNGKIPADSLLSHCVREAFHSQWAILLDEELRHAMEHGIRIVCPDGRPRQFFPRVFTYSADYPEKALVACIRGNGLSPCHRCLVPKKDLSRLGAPTDTEREVSRSDREARAAIDNARKEIFDGGYAVDTTKIEESLKPLSLVPTLNSFHFISTIQPGHAFSISDALVVDLMHEFEIGVWKRLYIHLIRLLHAFATTTTLTAELDSRYRATAPFGRDTIRKFGVNASDMKRKAARDFEDLLQCAIPAFESLLPEPLNSTVMTLLYICALWHALAKLRLHNDFTLGYLEYATTRLGAQMRRFDQEISVIPTKELPKEADARARKEGKGGSKAGGSTTRKPATLGIFTIKFHYLGDYVSSIRKRGTTDSYSTETGELAHRLPKSWYKRTDKKDFKGQMSQIERRQARLLSIRSTMELSAPAKPQPITTKSRGSRERPVLDHRYVMGASQNEPLSVSLFTQVPGSPQIDEHIIDFLPKLQQHLLPRIAEKLGFSADAIPEADASLVSISEHRLFNHQILRIPYTTYDVRRDEDVIHIDTPQCNIMVLNEQYAETTRTTEHPYRYGKVNGVFHANISFVGTLPDGTRNYAKHRLDFVWIHWYQWKPPGHEFELDRVSLTPLKQPSAVGFLDPAKVLRAVHIVPRFSKGKFGEQLRSQVVSNLEFWDEYYVNRFADRDLFMRFQYGMSVGHTYMHEADSGYPTPSVPQIPPGFDHHLTLAAQTTAIPPSTERPNADAASSSVTLQPPSVAASHATPTQDQSDEGQGPAVTPQVMDGGNLNSGSDISEGCPSLTDGVQQGEEEGGEGEEGEDGEEEGYWDDLEDHELMHYDDMFGCDDGDNL